MICQAYIGMGFRVILETNHLSKIKCTNVNYLSGSQFYVKLVFLSPLVLMFSLSIFILRE